jgi:hypothetical protein
MKKAKVMLATIAVFGLVGGALAFNASKHTGTLWYLQTNGNCPTIAATTVVGTTYTVALPSFSVGYFTDLANCQQDVNPTSAYFTSPQ